MNKLYHFQQLPLHTPKCYSSFESIRIDFLISTVLSRFACRNIPLPAEKTYLLAPLVGLTAGAIYARLNHLRKIL
jgi:hypothetical protein